VYWKQASKSEKLTGSKHLGNSLCNYYLTTKLIEQRLQTLTELSQERHKSKNTMIAKTTERKGENLTSRVPTLLYHV
jgi:p-aminobenzoyl-glutamate transporter AbgT